MLLKNYKMLVLFMKLFTQSLLFLCVHTVRIYALE